MAIPVFILVVVSLLLVLNLLDGSVSTPLRVLLRRMQEVPSLRDGTPTWQEAQPLPSKKHFLRREKEEDLLQVLSFLQLTSHWHCTTDVRTLET